MHILPIAALCNRGHQKVLSRHERQAPRDVSGDHRRIDYEPAGYVQGQPQDRIRTQKRLRNDQPSGGAVVQSSFKSPDS